MQGIIILAGLALLAGIGALLAHRRHGARRLARLRTQWGQAVADPLTPEEARLARAWHEAVRVPSDTEVDDITWNDLSMDALYRRFAPLTSAGQGVLYHLLRCPSDEPAEIARRDAAICALGGETAWPGVSRVLDALGTEARMNAALLFGTQAKHRPWVLYTQLALDVVLAACAVAGLLWSQMWLLGAVAALAASAAMRVRLNKRDNMEGDIPTLVYLMRLLQCLPRLTAALVREEALAAQRARLDALSARLRPVRQNPLLSLFFQGDMLTMYIKSLLGVDVIYYQRMLRDMARLREDIVAAYALVGELDALRAVAGWRARHPHHCVPCFDESAPEAMCARGLCHPLLPEGVPNDAALTHPALLTGSNASGKSTYLKAIGLAALMAQSVATCCAQAYSARMLAVKSSMALTDNVEAAESYFMAELRSLLRIVRYAGHTPCLALVDEVLRGTNTQERIAAAYAVLRALAASGAWVVAATHDGELTRLLADAYDNLHFQERLEDGRMVFDYKVHPGPARSRNALLLLESMGYDEAIVAGARRMLARFAETGQWEEA